MSATHSDIDAVGAATKLESYKELLVERYERVLVIRFNRAAVKNALDRRTYYELIRALNEASNDEAITVVALTGVGDTFSAGNDLTQTRRYKDVSEFFRSANYVQRSLVKAFLYCPKVLVAVVNGACIGIGFTLSALCDIVYCTETAYFQAPFSQLGLCPEACATYVFPRLLGRSKTTESLLFGEKLGAAEALQLGFVARVFRTDQLDDSLWPRITQYSQLPAESLRATKRLLSAPERDAMLKALQAECAELEKLRYGPAYLSAIEKFIARKGGSNKSKL